MKRFFLNLAEHRLTAGLSSVQQILWKDPYFEKKRYKTLQQPYLWRLFMCLGYWRNWIWTANSADEFSTAFILCYKTRSPTKKCTSEKFKISKGLIRIIEDYQNNYARYIWACKTEVTNIEVLGAKNNWRKDCRLPKKRDKFFKAFGNLIVLSFWQVCY